MHSPIVVATSVAMVEGQGWGPHNTSITNANTEQALIAALTTLHSQLLSGQTFANENAVKTCCMNKYSAVGGSTGGIWTRSVAQWYLRCMNTFAVPVVPTVAYPGQYFPPAYLFTPPPSALIPVVPVPQPTMVVANAVPIPVHNDAAWATATPVAVVATRYDNDGVPVANAVAMSIPIVPTVGGKSNSAASAVPTPTPNPTNNGGSGGSGGSGGAVWVDFDKNVTTEPQKIEQVPFVYTPPSNGSACWVNDDKIPISVEQVQEAVPIVQPRVVPKPEATLDYKDGDETTTDVWCTPEEQFDTTHINLWNNDITKFEGLHKFPNLLRLTVRSNEITNLQGVSSAKNLRWLDVSDNDVNSLNGLEGMSSLEWLDVHNNEFTSLAGMGLLPQLTFLNMRHSDLKHLKGIGTMLPRIRYIDVSSNDLTTIQGLEKCTYLTEINLNSNDLRDFNEIRPLLRLPYLKRLDLSNNYFTSKAIKNLRKIARSDNPNLEIIVNSGEANASNNGAARSGSSSSNDVSEGGSCCLMQ